MTNSEIQTVRVTCPVCFGADEGDPCDACQGRGYFLRRIKQQPTTSLTIQNVIDRGWVECPECKTQRGVDARGNVLNCGKCSDVFRAQASPWNLFIETH